MHASLDNCNEAEWTKDNRPSSSPRAVRSGMAMPYFSWCGNDSFPQKMQSKRARLLRRALTLWRREGDSNPRDGIRRQHDFQSCTFNRSDTSPRLFPDLSASALLICISGWLTYVVYQSKAHLSSIFLKTFLRNILVTDSEDAKGARGEARRIKNRSAAYLESG